MKKTVAILMIFCIFISFCSCKQMEDLLVPLNDGYPSEPLPTFIITIGGKQPNCIGGVGWSWYVLEDGTGVMSSGSRVHPLDLKYKPFKTTVGQADLQFSEPPTSFSVIAYPNVPEGEPQDDVHSIQIEPKEDGFALMEGDYIYEVSVGWEYEDKRASGNRLFNAVYMPEK